MALTTSLRSCCKESFEISISTGYDGISMIITENFDTFFSKSRQLLLEDVVLHEEIISSVRNRVHNVISFFKMNFRVMLQYQ